tara:strand:- start:34 stop:399 length:366 start_codon:yes stop_codon:yes gene_type:complete
MATGVVLIGLQAVALMHWHTNKLEDSLMNLASINSIVPAETTIGIVLILLAAAAKAIRSLSKRRFPSHLTLQTDSFDLHLQTKQLSSQQESLQQDQQGDDDNGNSNNDDGGISAAYQRPKL